jgi:hypothetical protein
VGLAGFRALPRMMAGGRMTAMGGFRGGAMRGGFRGGFGVRR